METDKSLTHSSSRVIERSDLHICPTLLSKRSLPPRRDPATQLELRIHEGARGLHHDSLARLRRELSTSQTVAQSLNHWATTSSVMTVWVLDSATRIAECKPLSQLQAEHHNRQHLGSHGAGRLSRILLFMPSFTIASHMDNGPHFSSKWSIYTRSVVFMRELQYWRFTNMSLLDWSGFNCVTGVSYRSSKIS